MTKFHVVYFERDEKMILNSFLRSKKYTDKGVKKSSNNDFIPCRLYEVFYRKT